MNCQSCSEPMALVYGQRHFHCVSCNQFEFTPESLAIEDIVSLDKQTDFACPTCFQSLSVGLIHEAVQICFCDNCRGFVIDCQSLGSLIVELRAEYEGDDDVPTPIAEEQLNITHNCPACTELMAVHPYYGPGSIVIDTCGSCQLAWLDHGELGRIVRAPGQRKA